MYSITDYNRKASYNKFIYDRIALTLLTKEYMQVETKTNLQNQY